MNNRFLTYRKYFANILKLPEGSISYLIHKDGDHKNCKKENILCVVDAGKVVSYE